MECGGSYCEGGSLVLGLAGFMFVPVSNSGDCTCIVQWKDCQCGMRSPGFVKLSNKTQTLDKDIGIPELCSYDNMHIQRLRWADVLVEVLFL